MQKDKITYLIDKNKMHFFSDFMQNLISLQEKRQILNQKIAKIFSDLKIKIREFIEKNPILKEFISNLINFTMVVVSYMLSSLFSIIAKSDDGVTYKHIKQEKHRKFFDFAHKNFIFYLSRSSLPRNYCKQM